MNWISVKERLPENLQDVMCLHKSGRQGQNSYCHHTDQDEEWFKDTFTHWKYLDPLPTEQHKEGETAIPKWATHRAVSKLSGEYVYGKYDNPYPGQHFIDEHDCDGTPSTPIDIETLGIILPVVEAPSGSAGKQLSTLEDALFEFRTGLHELKLSHIRRMAAHDNEEIDIPDSEYGQLCNAVDEITADKGIIEDALSVLSYSPYSSLLPLLQSRSQGGIHETIIKLFDRIYEKFEIDMSGRRGVNSFDAQYNEGFQSGLIMVMNTVCRELKIGDRKECPYSINEGFCNHCGNHNHLCEFQGNFYKDVPTPSSEKQGGIVWPTEERIRRIASDGVANFSAETQQAEHVAFMTGLRAIIDEIKELNPSLPNSIRVSGTQLLSELMKRKDEKNDDDMEVGYMREKQNGGSVLYIRHDAMVFELNKLNPSLPAQGREENKGGVK